MTKIVPVVLLVFYMVPVYAGCSIAGGKSLKPYDGVVSTDGFGPSGGCKDSWSREVSFIRHLISREDYRESLFLLERLEAETPRQLDSLNYLTGWVHYQKKSLELSAGYLLKVGNDSPVYQKSRFFAAYNFAHIGDAGKGREVLKRTDAGQDGLYHALQRLQLAGTALLERNLEQYRSYATDFSGNHHVTAAQEKQMEHHYNRLMDHRASSPFVAGVLSAAVPGLGKIYAGKPAEGVAGFLYVTALGLTAFDFYRGSGPDSVLFILSASAAGAFYVGNIVGSATAARRVNQEFNHEMDQRVLFDMHIPLRNAF